MFLESNACVSVVINAPLMKLRFRLAALHFRPTSSIMAEGSAVSLPQKKYFRQRAHSNPLSDHSFTYPAKPDDMDWSVHFPQLADGGSEEQQGSAAKRRKQLVEFADVGCGYGGLLVELSTMFPSTLMVGMEIRLKVSDFVRDRITALREQHPGQYTNVSVLRTNSMKYMVNYFHKGQLQKMFFLFPDPHFKKVKHKWRIISETLLAEYAYVLAEGGLVYTTTDVEDLHEWMTSHLDKHPLFEALSEGEVAKDPIVPVITECTEEGKKVKREGRRSYTSVYRRTRDPHN